MKQTLFNYIYNIHVALSQMVNTLAGGDPDESVSGRIGKAAQAGSAWAQWLDRQFGHHFTKSIEPDEGGNSAAGRQERV